ncbi:hypothetical protein FOA52_012872 [Chlamydomonas sp. UWO 241]|nr:hypothetical protein FOA52_012872 [Chlamydomonas sp. UWO 241]
MGRMLTKRVQHQHQLRQSQTGAAASQMLMPHPCASSGGLRPRAGAMQYLSEHFDLTKVPMVGASGGALLSVLAACGVPANAILARARELSLQHGIWERPMALVGIWGVILETWLDDLLPADAAEMCSGRVTVVVTQLPSMRQVGITDFVDRADLINACLASSHVPLVLDYRVSRTCRGVQCVDGQLPDFVSGVNSPILTAGGAAVVLDYFDDAALMRSGRFDMLQLKSYDEIVARVGVGYSYARGLHEGGRFEGFRLDGLALVGGGVVEEVLVPDA